MARYHIGMPIQVALTLMERGDKMYMPDVDYHHARATKLLAKGGQALQCMPAGTYRRTMRLHTTTYPPRVTINL